MHLVGSSEGNIVFSALIGIIKDGPFSFLFCKKDLLSMLNRQRPKYFPGQLVLVTQCSDHTDERGPWKT